MRSERQRGRRQRPGIHTLLLTSALSLGGALGASRGGLLLGHGGECFGELAKARDASLARCVEGKYATDAVESV
jgi:hypothetical protein